MQMSQFFRIPLLLVLSLVTVAGIVSAQQDGPPPGGQQHGQGRGMNGPPPVMGTITSVGVDRFEIKKSDGTSQVVMVSDQTHFRQRSAQQGQQGQPPRELALEDLKVGDHVFVRGTPNTDKQLTAESVNRISDEMFQRIQSGGGPGGQGGPGGGGGWGRGGGGTGPGGGGPRMGGEITAINGNQIKVQSRRNGEHVIVVNDQTTFDKEGKAITLKDLKVGDHIFAAGADSNGQFLATAVHSGRPGGGGFGGPGGPRGGGQTEPAQN